MARLVTLITPTADQPTGMALCERWLFQQTVSPDQWIVVDDGQKEAGSLSVRARELRYIRRVREPICSGAQSLCRNLLEALPHVWGDVVLIVEHDDYYHPTHIETMLERLSTHALVGDDQQRYYNLPARRWKQFQNRGASLCQTGFRRELLPTFQSTVEHCLARNTYGIDAAFWVAVPKEQQDLRFIGTVVGIKGLPGRTGLGIGHRPHVVEQWTPDPDGMQLAKWVGRDAAVYEQLSFAV